MSEYYVQFLVSAQQNIMNINEMFRYNTFNRLLLLVFMYSKKLTKYTD